MNKFQNKKNILFFSIVFFVMILLFFALFVPVFSSQGNDVIYCFDDEYRLVLEKTYPSLTFEKGKNKPTLRSFEMGKSIVTYKELAMDIIEANSDYTFIPHYKESVVIAIDRDATSQNIQSFKNLFESKNEISFFLGKNIAQGVWGYENAQHIYASLCFSLFDNYNIKELAIKLDTLEDCGKLFVNEYKPFMIMSDREAAALKKQGKNLEIVVPNDGTHTFVCGLLTNKKIETDKTLLNTNLIENGFMTMESKTDTNYYADLNLYKYAKEISNTAEYNSLAKSANKTIRRTVFNVKRFGFATTPDRMVFFVVLSCLILFYMSRLDKRVKQKNICTAIKTINLAQIGLMAVFVFRMMSSGTLYTILWYFYYVFFGILSNAYLYIALTINQSKNKPKITKIFFTTVLIITSVCLAFVLLNDTHHLVFEIVSVTAGVDIYSYNFAYYILAFVLYFPVVFSTAVMIYKAHKSPRKFALLFPLLCVAMLFVYGFLYFFDFAFCKDFDVAFAVVLFAWLIIESCLKSGLVPINIGYNKLFSMSKLKMQIIPIGSCLNGCDLTIDKENFEKQNLKLDGGEIVYYNNIKEIKNIKKKFDHTIKKLEENNIILQKESFVTEELEKNIALEKTYNKIASIIKEDKIKIANLLDKMKTASNAHILACRINIIAVGIKRKSMLEIDSATNQTLSQYIVHSAIAEIGGFIKNTSLKFATACNLSSDVKINKSILDIYAAYLKFIDFTLEKNITFLFAQVYEENQSFILSLTTDKQVLTKSQLQNICKNNSIKPKQKVWENNFVVKFVVNMEESL